jgi:glucose-6-phosphate isomerase
MEKLGKPLVVVISESGSTSEPHNAMLEVMATYKKYLFFFPLCDSHNRAQ